MQCVVVVTSFRNINSQKYFRIKFLSKNAGVLYTQKKQPKVSMNLQWEDLQF